jgi:hypothetical protein
MATIGTPRPVDVAPRLQDGTIVYALPVALVSATAT